VDLEAEQVGNPRVFKSHEAATTIAKGAKYIHVCRDPEDAFMSFYRFLPPFVALPPDSISIDEFAEAIFGGASVSGGIWDFYNSWWERRNDPDVLWVCFEDLKSDLAGQVKRIAKFMDIECDDAKLSKVLELSSFKYMADNQGKFDAHIEFERTRKGMGIPEDYVWGSIEVSKVRKGGGTTGEGKGIPPHILEMLRKRWKMIWKHKLHKKLVWVVGGAWRAIMYQQLKTQEIHTHNRQLKEPLRDGGIPQSH